MGPGLRLRKRLYRLFSNRKLTFTKQCAFNGRFLDFNDIYRVSLIRRITTGPLHRFKRLQILHHFILQKAYEVLHMIEIALQNTGVKFIHFVYIDRKSVAIQLPYIRKISSPNIPSQFIFQRNRCQFLLPSYSQLIII